ncbi:MAG: hypothetical protein PF588_05550 [Candidatus Kapabacteria bacterium]|jgi:hypothetical protein|nr:hypothetical protein [Candidatus Kapabacteria bacterium]
MKNIIIILLLIFCAPIFTEAQEIQVPIDNENKVLVVDKDLESKLAIFTEYKGFVDAKLFKSDDGTFVLEVTYKVDSKLHRKRNTLSQEEVDELRIKVTDSIKSDNPAILLDQSGRTSFIVGTTILGLGYYGWAVPLMFDAESAEANVGLYSVTSFASFLVPYLITEKIPVTEAAADLSIYGGAAGLGHGLLLYLIFGDDFNDGYHDEYGYYYESSNPFDDALPLMMLTSLAELTAGYFIATKTNMSVGKADVIASVGTFGALAGLGTQVIIDYDAGKEAFGIAGLLGSAAGLAAGNVIANGQDFSKGDAKVFSTAGVLGAWIPFCLYMSAAFDAESFSGEALTGASMAGSILGLVAGNYLVKDLDFTSSQGSYIAWGTPLGGLLGFGLGFMINTDTPTTGLVGSAIGSTVTFALLYNTFKKDARDFSALDGLDVNFSPVGLATMMSGTDYGVINNRPVVSPILDISFKW